MCLTYLKYREIMRQATVRYLSSDIAIENKRKNKILKVNVYVASVVTKRLSKWRTLLKIAYQKLTPRIRQLLQIQLSNQRQQILKRIKTVVQFLKQARLRTKPTRFHHCHYLINHRNNKQRRNQRCNRKDVCLKIR